MLRTTGDYAAARAAAIEASEIAAETLGRSHPDYATTLDTLAQIHLELAEYELAERLFEEAADIRKRAPDVDPSEYARSLANLATVGVERGEYDAAESRLKRAIAIFVGTVGPSIATRSTRRPTSPG